ncbi:Mak10-domain-containing protein [Trichodelitschia bisporula]|uniref:Mak10-domain-containing protein n=1 Tax=Trichodelitschia bisporula TaxID=703511 RepID=A0A6G1HMD1_9PEZI|nr:Mak10-domain-containing protein [Trichodelitschia bisporula]
METTAGAAWAPPSRQYHDITADFRTAAGELPIGVLVKDDFFTLFESVAALEIMDPKMDTGCLAPGEALIDDYDVCRELRPEEVIGIMDQLLCAEMAWHGGYPLSQTVLSSHYIYRLLPLQPVHIHKIVFHDLRIPEPKTNTIVHLVLRAYCLALVKSCDATIRKIHDTNDMVGRVNIYEEEDFSTGTFNRWLLSDIPRETIVSYLDHAIGWLAEQSLKHRSADQATNVWEALIERLEFRARLLIAMDGDEGADAALEWSEVSDSLSAVADTHDLGTPVPESFSPKIQRKLASTVPPKPMAELGFADAAARMKQLIRDCQEASRILQVGLENVARLEAFLCAFNARNPEPLPYARACLSAPLFRCEDAEFEMLLRKDLSETLLPDDPVLDPVNWTVEAPVAAGRPGDRRYETARVINDFTGHVVRMNGGYIDYFRALCSNRCRLRRNLRHVANALDDLQRNEAPRLDAALAELTPLTPPSPLTSWTYLLKLKTMQWIVQLGFELDIYLPDEMAGMYWFLAKLARERTVALNAALLKVQARGETRDPGFARAQKRGERTRAVALLESLGAEGHATVYLASALSELYTVLSYHGAITQTATPDPYTTPHLRFTLRMKPLLSIASGPALPSFADFEEATHPYGPFASPTAEWEQGKDNMLTRIGLALSSARAAITRMKEAGPQARGCEKSPEAWKGDVQALTASCLAVSVACARLGHGGEVKVEIPGMGRRYHEWWVVPKVG